MFSINGKEIKLTCGDTASFTVQATGVTFTADDRALFTVKAADGTIVYQNTYTLNGSPNGQFTVELHNQDTDTLSPGAYSWDVRYVINPYYDASGKIVNGDQVITPDTAHGLTLVGAIGEV